MENKTLTVKELKDYLKIGQNTAYRLTKRADFPAVRISPRRIVIPLAGLEKWLENQHGEF